MLISKRGLPGPRPVESDHSLPVVRQRRAFLNDLIADPISLGDLLTYQDRLAIGIPGNLVGGNFESGMGRRFAGIRRR